MRNIALDFFKPFDINTFFENGFNNQYAGGSALNHIPTNVVELEKSFELELALPGVSKDLIQMEIKAGQLKIWMENQSDDSKNSFVQAFTKNFKLTDKVDITKIAATMENGVLYVTLPKKAEVIAVERRIEIK